MFRRTLQLAVATVSIGSSAFAADLAGTYATQTPQGPLLLTLHQKQGKLSGTVQYGNQQFPIIGQPSGNQLVGSWAGKGGAVPFAASIDGTHLILNTNGVTYELDKSDATPSHGPAAQIGAPRAAPSPDDAIDELVRQHWTLARPQTDVDSVQWNDIVFSDNTGAVSMPQGWRIASVQAGCPGIFGPNGEIVALGQRLSYSENQLPYRGAVESAKVIWTQFSDTFNPPVKFVQIIDARDAGKTPDGAESADISFIADLGRGGTTQRVNGHLILQCGPPDARGNWKAIYSAMLAPSDSYEAAEPIMTRIWNSWQLNPQQVIANTRSQLAAQVAASRQSWAFTNAAVARAQHTMNVSGRQVEDFCDTMGGTGMAVNNQTGRLVPLGNNTVGDLNRASNAQHL